MNRGAFEIVNGKKIYESQRRAKRLYKLRNRAKVNASRRARRAHKRLEVLADRRCGNCTILIAARNGKGGRKYCRSCREQYPNELRAKEPRRCKALSVVLPFSVELKPRGYQRRA